MIFTEAFVFIVLKLQVVAAAVTAGGETSSTSSSRAFWGDSQSATQNLRQLQNGGSCDAITQATADCLATYWFTDTSCTRCAIERVRGLGDCSAEHHSGWCEAIYVECPRCSPCEKFQENWYNCVCGREDECFTQSVVPAPVPVPVVSPPTRVPLTHPTTPKPAVRPTQSPTNSPTPMPSKQPQPEPTQSPTNSPTSISTLIPTDTSDPPVLFPGVAQRPVEAPATFVLPIQGDNPPVTSVPSNVASSAVHPVPSVTSLGIFASWSWLVVVLNF